MPRLLALIVFATCAAVPAAAQGPRLTRVEGAVIVDATTIRTAAGRASTRLADGTLLHLDADTVVGFLAPDLLDLVDGRAVVQTGRFGPVRLSLPFASLRLAPAGTYTIVQDGRRSRLLVRVAGGQADVATRYGTITPVLPGQQALMLGATGTPWASAYSPVLVDGFEAWAALDGWSAPVRVDADWYDDRATPGIEPPSTAGWSTGAAAGRTWVTDCGWAATAGPCWGPPFAAGAPWGVRPLRPGWRPGRVPDGWTDHPDFVPAYEAGFERRAGPTSRRDGQSGRREGRRDAPADARREPASPPAATARPAGRAGDGQGLVLPSGRPPGATAGGGRGATPARRPR